MHTRRNKSQFVEVFIRIAIGLLLLSSVLYMTGTAKAASFCQCVEYIKNVYKLSGNIGSGGAKSMGPYLIERGFTKVSKPQVGAVVIFKPAFGGGVDQTSGHVGIITKVENLDTKWRIKVEGANQGGNNTKHDCNNVNNIFYTKYSKNWGGNYIQYYVPPKTFSSGFSSGSAGWSPVVATWQVSSKGHYHSAGKSNKFSSAKHTGNYSTMTYQVAMKRTGCSNCGNYIYFRGKTSPLNSDGRWVSGYVLEYSNSGYWTIGKQVNGEYITFIDWTYSPNISSGWNTLKVSAYGNYLEFYINGILFANGTDSEFLAGQVGFGFHRTSALGHLYVDSASLNLNLPLTLPSIKGLTFDQGEMDRSQFEGAIDFTGRRGNSDPRMSP